MTYADYDFYKNEYFGRAITEDNFPRLALRGSQYIDYITQGRAVVTADLEAVKMCCCELAEQYQLIDTAESLASHSLNVNKDGGGEVSSETVGSWSRSYQSGGYSAQTAIQAARESKSNLYSIAVRHLANTGLLYRGGCHNGR